MGAWIETNVLTLFPLWIKQSHPTWVRGLKRNTRVKIGSQTIVASYMGAWIETVPSCFVYPPVESHPTWVRGLKLDHSCINCGGLLRRILHGCVD